MLRRHPDLSDACPASAVFPHPNATTTPLALRTNADFNRVVHDRVILVQIVNENVPHIRHVDRVEVEDLGDATDGFVHVKVHVGFTDSQDIPKGLALAVGKTPELDIDLDEARYFLSVLTVQATGHRGLRTWRKRLFAWMYHNAATGQRSSTCRRIGPSSWVPTSSCSPGPSRWPTASVSATTTPPGRTSRADPAPKPHDNSARADFARGSGPETPRQLRPGGLRARIRP